MKKRHRLQQAGSGRDSITVKFWEKGFNPTYILTVNMIYPSADIRKGPSMGPFMG
jgi:hypothetical protein